MMETPFLSTSGGNFKLGLRPESLGEPAGSESEGLSVADARLLRGNKKHKTPNTKQLAKRAGLVSPRREEGSLAKRALPKL